MSHILFKVIGSHQNSQIEIRKHTSSTLRIFSLSAQKVLQKHEPNEIQIKIDNRKYIRFILLFQNTTCPLF